MKKLLFENKRLIENETSSISQSAKSIDYIIEFWKTNQLGKLTHALVRDIVSKPDATIKEIYKNKLPDTDPYTGLKNNKDKLLDGQELPHLDPERLRLVEIAVNKEYLSLFDLGEEATVNQMRLEKYIDKYRYYTDSADVLTLYEELLQIAERLNKLNSKFEFQPLHPTSYGESDYFFDGLSELYSITPDGLKIKPDAFVKAIAKQKRVEV
jgi:hypothetical protein